MIITAGRVVTPARVFAPGWVHVEGEHVTDVGSDAPPRPADVELQGTTVVPGYVDAHVHGGGGASFDTGTAEAAETVAAVHLAHGTTTIMASLVTDTTAELDRSVRELAKLAAAGTLAGIHLEGPWLSPKHAGAHDPALLADPKPAEVDRLVEAADGHLRMVTLAPELTGGLDAVRRGHGCGNRRRDRPHGRVVRRGPRGAGRGCRGRNPSVQRDARAAPPRARTRRRAARAPGTPTSS